MRLRVTLLWYKPYCFSNVIMLSTYWSLSQHGQLQPHSKSKAWKLSTQLYNGLFKNHSEKSVDWVTNWNLLIWTGLETLFFVIIVFVAGHQHCGSRRWISSIFQGGAICCWTWVSQCPSRTCLLPKRWVYAHKQNRKEEQMMCFFLLFLPGLLASHP